MLQRLRRKRESNMALKLETKVDSDTINRNHTTGYKNQVLGKFIISFDSTRFKYNVLIEWSRFKTQILRTSLVAQWIRIHLPMQGTQVRALVREDPTCRGATKLVRHNYWACALEPTSHNYWSPRATTTEARAPQLLKPTRLEPVLRNKRSHRNEKPAHHNEEEPPLAPNRESPHAATKT